MESFEQNGIWFLPENPDREIAGTLVFSLEQTPRLNLFGELKDFDIKEKLETSINYPIIHGCLISNSGTSEKVTLCECNQKNEWSSGVNTSELYPKYILKGYHFFSLDDIKFPAMIVQYNYLEKWVNLPNIKIDCIPNNQQKSSFKEIICKQEVNEPIEIGKINDCSITIIDTPLLTPQVVQFANFFGWNRSEILLKEQKNILIKPENPKKLEDFLEIVNLIQEFLTFACGQITLPFKVETAIIANEKESEPQLFNGEWRVVETEKEKQFPIKIVYQVSSPLINKVSFDPRRIMFKFTDIRNNSATVLNKWQNIREKLSSIIQLYLGLYYTPSRHTNDYFLSLAQAVEGFHRMYYQEAYCDKDTFKKINEELKKTFSSELTKYSIEESYHDSLLKKVEYWNEYSLKERLEDLFYQQDVLSYLPNGFLFEQEDWDNLNLVLSLMRKSIRVKSDNLVFDFYFSYLIFPLKKIEDFNKEVSNVRGFLTHHSSKSSTKKDRLLSNQNLKKLITRLRIILEICLLQSVDIYSSKIKEIVRNRSV